MHARLGDMDYVQDAVNLPVASQVEPVVPWLAVAFPGGDGDGRGAAPAGELSFGAEPGRVPDLGQQGHRGDDSDANNLGEGAAELVQEGGHLGIDALEVVVDGLDGGQGGTEPGGATVSARPRPSRSRVGIALRAAMTRLVAGSWSRTSMGNAHRTAQPR